MCELKTHPVIVWKGTHCFLPNDEGMVPLVLTAAGLVASLLVRLLRRPGYYEMA